MYLVKGYITEGEKQKSVSILAENASSCIDAITTATEKENITDVVAVSLSPVKEVINHDDSGTYYTASVQTEEDENGKAQTYQMIIIAKDFETAQKVANDTLEQGYGMTLVALRKTKLYAIV